DAGSGCRSRGDMPREAVAVHGLEEKVFVSTSQQGVASEFRTIEPAVDLDLIASVKIGQHNGVDIRPDGKLTFLHLMSQNVSSVGQKRLTAEDIYDALTRATTLTPFIGVAVICERCLCLGHKNVK